IPVNVKSTIKTRSHAGRDHFSGDQIIVPNEVTRSMRIWLRIPTPKIPASAGKEGASHLRRRPNHRVSPASARAKNGRQTREWVILRCQVITSISLLENRSRKVSESGKMA